LHLALNRADLETLAGGSTLPRSGDSIPLHARRSLGSALIKSACCKAAFSRAAALQKRNRPRGMFNTASPDFSFAPCRPKKFSFSRTAF
ncbi:hypothetical protein, partial [Desulfovibrio sp.]|uniref:hypothetical protein n=1 Tax=Desulfovibrio sp. TaxID=885 RepID=UPI0025C15C79